MEQLKLYPQAPGWKKQDTSRQAAKAITGKAKTLRDAALAQFRSGPHTADEVADLLGESVLAIRPRITEPARQGQIEDTYTRRQNQSGRAAIVWRAR